MSAKPPITERYAVAKPNERGQPSFDWSLTSSSITDTVMLIAGPFDVLPVVFVPGIMGSNLKATKDGSPVWRLDKGMFGLPTDLAKTWGAKKSGLRQRVLHPAKVEVDHDGAVPKGNKARYSPETYKDRGWGTVAETSYHDFLLWLDEKLNPVDRNPARWSDFYQAEATIEAIPKPGAQPKLFPGIKMGLKGEPFNAEKAFSSLKTDDLIKRAKFLMPVYAVGYNWLDDNKKAAAALATEIQKIIRANNNGHFRCKQVIVVTHSMGGLVARACAKLDGMDATIAGIVHGVMPAVGAAVAYRRCKVGMADESYVAGLVIGSTGQEVTAVFAQAPGALELLPTQQYRGPWLKICDAKGQAIGTPMPSAGDAFAEIYLERKQWWGLVNEAWLAPTEGAPITWDVFRSNVILAQKFHAKLEGSFHSETYAFYGANAKANDKKTSFECVTWRLKEGLSPDGKPRPNLGAVRQLDHGQIRGEGSNPAYVGGATEVVPFYGEFAMPSTYESSYWEVRADKWDGYGDGTVPASSGGAPLRLGGDKVKQQFKIPNIEHETAYNDDTSRMATLYAITKLAGQAKVPA